ncbi:glycosyltransferase family 9 protein [Acidobacteria bacterium AB60]|nr:glycosyltransferase family 9 protein [Acidobacteria bacterium AB60]
MGDILHALPALTALRRQHPSWTIDWVIEPAWAPLLSARSQPGTADTTQPRSSEQPLVDHLHLAAAKAWGKQPLAPRTAAALAALRRTLRAGCYDAVLDFQGAVRSAALGWLAGTRRRIGESHPREFAARWLFTERVSTRGVHVIEQDLELAAAVAGDDLQPISPLLPIDPAAEAWCDTLLASCPPPLASRLSPLASGPSPVCLLNPGAGWGAKRWPLDRYASVAATLASRGFCVLVNAGPSEEAMAETIRAGSGGAARPVTCTLAQLIALTRRVALLIAGDTGPLHLACALGRPVVGIYGPTDPARNGPYGTRFRVLRSPFSQRNHARRAEPESGLLTITPDQVLAAVDEVLAPAAPHPEPVP